MKIKLLQDCVVNKSVWPKGTEIETDDHTAKRLIYQKKAVAVEPKAADKKS